MLRDSGTQLLIADIEFAPQLNTALSLLHDEGATAAGAGPTAAPDAPAASTAMHLHTVMWTDLARASPHSIHVTPAGEASAMQPAAAPPSLPFGVTSMWYTGKDIALFLCLAISCCLVCCY